MDHRSKTLATIRGGPVLRPDRIRTDLIAVSSLPRAPIFTSKSSPCISLASMSEGTINCGTSSQAKAKASRRCYSEHDGKPCQPHLEELKMMSKQSSCQRTDLISTMPCSMKLHNISIDANLPFSSPDRYRTTNSYSARCPMDCQFCRLMWGQEVSNLGHIPRLQSPILSSVKGTQPGLKSQGYDGTCDADKIDPSSDYNYPSNEPTPRSSTIQLCGTHALPDEGVTSARSSLDWASLEQRARLGEAKDKEHNHFLNPFNDSSDHQSRKSSSTSGHTGYIRPNAFPGHRDTFARILHAQVFHNYDDHSSSGSISTSATHTRRSSAYAMIPYTVLQLTLRYLAFADYKFLRLVCRQWCQDLPPPRFSAFYRLPHELVQQILGYLSPCDFDSSRHTCASWYFASQDRKLQGQMLTLACCNSAFQQDLRLHRSPDGGILPSFDELNNISLGHAVDLSNLSQEWICGKRLATESRLSPDWHGRSTSQSNASSRVSLMEEIDFSTILDVGGDEATRSNFTVSACRKFVLVTSRGDISIFSLFNQDDALKPVVKLTAGDEVLKVSMDTSSGRYAVAALLAGRKGMLWELLDDMTQTRYRTNSGEPISLGMQADVQSSALAPVSRDISLNLSMRTAESHSANVLQLALGISDDPSPPTAPAPSSDFNEYLGQRSTQGGDTVVENQNEPARNSVPIETNATALYTNLGSPDDEPRSVSVCPNRKCLAFRCRMGIELHWVDALTGGDLSRWFPLAAPSEFLFFLPARENVDPRKKLRLISSAAGPGAAPLTRSDTTHTKWRYWQTSALQGRRQSMTRLFFGNLPLPTATISTGQWSNSLMPIGRQSDDVQGVLRTVDCDHYRAVPLSDGTHLLFTDPLTGLLCLGADAPLGGPTKLARKVVFTPPPGNGEDREQSHPRRYTAGKELRWGVRVVAAHQDGTIILYNVPRDLFEHIQDSRRSSSALAENQGIIGQSDLLVDSLVDSQAHNPEPSSNAQTSPTRSVQIMGAELMRVEDNIIDDLAVDASFGGFSLWIFCRRGVARLYNIYHPQTHQVKFRYVGENGLLYERTGVDTNRERARENGLKGKGKAGDSGRRKALHVTWT